MPKNNLQETTNNVRFKFSVGDDTCAVTISIEQKQIELATLHT